MTHPLSTRVAAASGPSRELDAEIWRAVKQSMHDRVYWTAAMGKPTPLPPWPEILASGLGIAATRTHAPRYTESLDAAMTLVPDGLYWLVGKGRSRPNEPLYDAQVFDEKRMCKEEQSETNAALALCAAALKARGL